ATRQLQKISASRFMSPAAPKTRINHSKSVILGSKATRLSALLSAFRRMPQSFRVAKFAQVYGDVNGVAATAFLKFTTATQVMYSVASNGTAKAICME